MKEYSKNYRKDLHYEAYFNDSTIAQKKKGRKGFHLDEGFVHRLSSSSTTISFFQFQPKGVFSATPPCSLHTFLSNGLVKRFLEFMFLCIHKNGYYEADEKVEDIHEMIEKESFPVSTKNK